MTVERLPLHGVPAVIARPTGAPTSGVIVLHQAAGYTPQIEAWLERLAGAGHYAIAPLLLHHRGVETVDPGARFGGDMGAFARFLPSDEEAQRDVTAVLSALSDAGVALAATGVLGFSYGGRAAYLTAVNHQLGGAVGVYAVGVQRKSFQGNDELPALADRTPSLQTPWLGLCGERDFLLETGELDDWEQDLAASPVPARLVRYTTAGHGFDVDAPGPAGAPSPYDEVAALDAASQIERFFANTLR